MTPKNLAVGILVAPALVVSPVAQADMSIYGRAHLSVDYLDNDGDYSANNVSNNSSRIGVRGSHQINEAVTGIWQVESNVETAGDSDNGRLGTRNSFVGLEGSFGRARIGYSDTVTKGVSRATDLFGDQLGDSRNLLNGLGDQRFRNAVFYDSPEFGGFTLSLNYSTNNNSNSTAADGNDDSAYSIGGVFKDGPLYVGVGHEVRDSVSGTDSTATRIGAYHDFADLRVTGLYQTATTNADVNLDTFGLGLRYRMGAWALKGQYYTTRNEGEQADASMIAVGVDYALGSQTTVYLAYAMTDNDDNATYQPAGGGHGDSIPGVLGGSSPWAIGLGVKHDFRFDL
jgi:predicted porin